MKKAILAVILLAAAGGGVCYFLLNKKPSSSNIQKNLIIGKWKMNSLREGKDSVSLFTGIMGMIDSNIFHYNYDFRKDGSILKLLKDSAQKDTSHYEWSKRNVLLWKEQGDSIGELLTIAKLSTDSMVLQTKDSATIYFKRTSR
jgi:hypothetical protein